MKRCERSGRRGRRSCGPEGIIALHDTRTLPVDATASKAASNIPRGGVSIYFLEVLKTVDLLTVLQAPPARRGAMTWMWPGRPLTTL